MAEDEPYVRRSVKDLAAGLTPGEVGRVPITSKPAKPIVKPKINRSISASVPPVGTSPPQPSNQPAGDPSGAKPPPVLPARRPTDKPAPPTAPPRRAGNNDGPKPSVPGLPPRRPTDTPSLPPRRPSEASSTTTNGSTIDFPSLPPRRPSDRPDLQSRRASQLSIASTASAVSSVSKISTASARTNGTARTGSSGDQPRVRAPVFDPASLPPLPPKREKKTENEAPPPRLPTRGKSTTSLHQQARAESPPPPSLPTRPGSVAVGQPSKRLPPTVIPPARPRPEQAAVTGFAGANGYNGQAVAPQGPAVIILNARNFDEVVLQSGKPALVDFSANFCKYCKELDPIYDELGNDFRHVSDRLVIAKVDCAVQKTLGSRFDIKGWPTIKWFDGRGSEPEIYPYQRTYTALSEYIEEKTGFKPQKGGPANGGAPPPIPLNTRPDLASLMKTKPSASTAGGGSGCLHCRDFSGPDEHAAKFPRQNVRSLSQLAHDLTAPFSSATDKARAIFKWCHHNIAYDCPSFFGGNVRNVSPDEVLRSGVAVCGGYAGIYADLALKAGLECIVVSGHGKGFGYKPLAPGEPVPPESQGHAWNAVKIDFGGPEGNGRLYWKLIDPCWGAGSVNGTSYSPGWNYRQFNMSNIDFGRTHFPEDRSKQFRADGRTLSWDQYFLGEAGGEPPFIYSGPLAPEGFSAFNMLPPLKRIPVDPAAHAATGGIVRFQFQRVCDHWKPEVNGRGKDMLYVIPTSDKRVKLPFETNGTYWWCDVHISKLGTPGTTILLMTVDSMAGKSSRGMTRDEYLKLQERGNGSGGSGLAAWELV